MRDESLGPVLCHFCHKHIGTKEDPIQDMGILDCCVECRITYFPDAVRVEEEKK